MVISQVNKITKHSQKMMR